MPNPEKRQSKIDQVLQELSPQASRILLVFLAINAALLGGCNTEKSAQQIIERAVASGNLPAGAMNDPDLNNWVQYGGRDLEGYLFSRYGYGSTSSRLPGEEAVGSDFAATEMAAMPGHILSPPHSNSIAQQATQVAAEQAPAVQPTQQKESFQFGYGGNIESVEKGVFGWLAPTNTEVTSPDFIEQVKKLLGMERVWFLVFDTDTAKWKIISPGANPQFWVYGSEKMYIGDNRDLQEFAKSQGFDFETVPYSP